MRWEEKTLDNLSSRFLFIVKLPEMKHTNIIKLSEGRRKLREKNYVY